VLGEHPKLPHDLRQLTIAALVEGECDLVLAGLFGLHDVLVIGGLRRIVLGERFERKDHVRYGDRLAVMEARLRTQTIGRRGEVGRMPHGVRQQPIVGRDLVQRGVEQHIGGEHDLSRQRSLHDADGEVEIVERAGQAHAHEAALGGVLIDVVEMLEVRRVFDRAVQ